ncbi:hypothetical protein [Nostoc sp. PA-18-2419]|uniref:hypothetical protein n=1 Tax=Nostoc sp. PA-18-2419 TaxID=2575443 RepID=UPI001109F377|nr:hypothetical protein [Nostoc sp. PA-18-2419]
MPLLLPFIRIINQIFNRPSDEDELLSGGIKINFNLGIVNDGNTKIYVIYHTHLPLYYYTHPL